ncbi:MAG TPA: hypothetical protein VGN13_12975 [Solirubrobacteraceae bacterium]|jgi:hypothetical protein
MQAVEAGTTLTAEHDQRVVPDWDHAFAEVLVDRRRRHSAGTKNAATPLRCVSGGYLTNACSCSASVPQGVVSAAWERQLEGGCGEGFFRFAWQEQVWLGYGLAGGNVKGVYCPAHSAERDRRLDAARTSAHAPHPSA